MKIRFSWLRTSAARLLPRRRWLILPVTAAVLLTGVAAYAYWSSQGQGAGSASAGTAQPLTISTGTPTASLFPGGSADVAASVHNPNSFHIHVSSISATGFSSNVTGCGLSFATQTNGGTGWDVPGSGTLDLDLPGSISMGATAANSCQNQSFTIELGAS
jgi:hypothetical protein